MTKILILITIITILLLIFVTCYSKLKDQKIKVEYTDDTIKNALEKKADLITKINNEIKKKLEKKNYLKDYINLNNKNLTSIELDIKLDEGFEIITNLISDFPELKNKELKKLYSDLKRNEEILYSSKTLYNKYSTSLNRYIRKFPYNICSKIVRIRIKPFYNLKEK